MVFESSKCPLANIFASKHFSSKKLRVKWKFSWKILFLKKFESEMKVFLYAYIECIPWGNEVDFIALTGYQTYASFSAHYFVLYWARDVLCATFSGFCFKVYYDLAFLRHPQPKGQKVAPEVTAFSAKKIACITFASGLNSKIWAMKRRTRREHNLRYSREVCLPRV